MYGKKKNHLVFQKWMHDFALFHDKNIVVKVCVCVCVHACVWVIVLLPLFALLLVLVGCHSGSSFPASTFGAESYPLGNCHKHQLSAMLISFLFVSFLEALRVLISAHYKVLLPRLRKYVE